ncbi:dTMP kinase [Rubrobacter aplysinae]|uniref:dTMP kinase n=1 Tax=Rubrobacter aplysinae TaxID=909625 RepID=UPI00069F38DC|nr:dTMP kinase [Rubrobacter aplysinae]
MTIEGLDFSGKSTLVRLLRQRFSETPALGQTMFTREPGGTPAAERIREVLLDPELEVDAWTEAYLYAAARADHVRNGLRPALAEGAVVVCERYLDSSLAYQGAGRGLGVDTVRWLNGWAVDGLVPDRTFYLALDAAERERRAWESGASLDRIERAGAGFMGRAEECFEELAQKETERMVRLDATSPPGELAEAMLREVRDLLYTHPG